MLASTDAGRRMDTGLREGMRVYPRVIIQLAKKAGGCAGILGSYGLCALGAPSHENTHVSSVCT